jgi:hypothetical protein
VVDEIGIVGIPVPDAGPLFLTALTAHVAARLTCVTCGSAAALSREGTRHRRFGRIYLWALGVVLTGFYVDNGPHLPGWDRLPAWTFWILPSLIALPVIARPVGRRPPAKGATS